MKNLLIFVLLLTTYAMAKDRHWQDGKLVTLKVESTKGDATVKATANQWGGVAGQINSSNEINYYATVRDGKLEYLAGRKLYGGKMPLLTENAPVKYVVEKDILILRDDNGKEFKMRLAKKTVVD